MLALKLIKKVAKTLAGGPNFDIMEDLDLSSINNSRVTMGGGVGKQMEGIMRQLDRKKVYNKGAGGDRY